MTRQKGHPLSGADHFHLLIDRQMRQKGLPGNISRIHLQLAPDADLHALKQRLEHDPTLRRVQRLRIHLRWPLMPRWEEDAATNVPPVVIHPVLSPQQFDLAVMNAPVPPRHCLVRIDLATQTDGSHHAVIAMHHALFDHRGMMLFLAALDSGTAPAQFFAPEAATSTWADMTAAFRATLFALASGGRRLATLVDRHTRPTATVRYHNLHLTTEETAQADLLLHVVDSASPDRDQQINAVRSVLQEIGALDVPQIMVWNKVDLTAASPGIERDDCGNISCVRLSARTGVGVSLLREALAEVASRHDEIPAAAA